MTAGMPESNQLTTLQTLGLILCFMIGAELFTLPREVVNKVGTVDAWASVVLGGVFNFGTACIMILLSQRFQNLNFYEYVQQITGTIIGKCIGLVVVLYYIHLASYEMRSMEEVASFFLLEGTPGWAILAWFVWISLYLCMEGISTIGKLCQIIIPISVTVLILIYFLGFSVFDLNNLRPVGAKGWMPIMKGMPSTTLAFSGSECFLFILCRMQAPKKAYQTMAWGIGLAIIFYTAAVIICIGVFSLEGVPTRTWPFFDLARSVEVEDLLLERFESLLLAIWIIQIFSIFTIVFYCAALGISHIFKVPYKKSLFLILPVICILSQLPKNINEVFALGQFIGRANMILFSSMPLLLLLIARWRVNSP
ncbi:GerAB/ArcD/ProY family transporter [Paenibacillus sp. UASWS1643]|uniref:GerAB/ArcD/ProY family transporter n=1 Tax=Paenibacillus sp. UASWS1643 TaxID=2580422 RepID=UPI00123916A6|nr:GerAB/ArcD/ProY family transporter [Paenibacillus sp. UASWS1643]KAA8747587.1 GerAB/ArcD/ProY family transporter [Paenibacillus sp. UASWS1643]